MKLINDWAWKPDQATKEALRRGDFKVHAYNVEGRQLLNFHAEPFRHIPKEETRRREKDQKLVRAYVERVTDSGQLKAGRMQWVALIDQSNKGARVVSKHENEMAARRAAIDVGGMEEYTVLYQGRSLYGLTDLEVDKLMLQFGDGRTGLHRPLKEMFVRGYLEEFDPSWHRPDGQASNGHYKQPAVPKEEIMEPTSGSTMTKKAPKGKPAKASANVKGKAAKKAAAAPPAKAGGKGKTNKKAPAVVAKEGRQKLPGDGLGREGTPSRFIRERLLAGEAIKDIFAAAVKKFPQNRITNSGYVNWYHNDMVKRGLIKKH